MRLLVTRTQNVHRTPALLGGLGVGAALMYYLDNERGAKRRELLRDRVTHALDVVGDAAGTTSHELAKRARGIADEARGLADDARALADDGIRALEGGESRPAAQLEVRRESRSPAARVLASVAGGAIALYGLRRRDRIGSALSMAGLALLSRGATNRDLRDIRARSRRSGIHILKSATIDAPVEQVFAFLTNWEKFPHWMSHVRGVRSLGSRGAVGERTHWEVDGPASGTTASWDAVTTRFEPNRLVAWKSVGAEGIRQIGRMRFRELDDGGTRVTVDLQYSPPIGVRGHGVAALFKRDPESQIDDDLARLKRVIETGHGPIDATAATDDSDDVSDAGTPKARNRRPRSPDLTA